MLTQSTLDALGMSLLVVGFAFVVSGLIFSLPRFRKRAESTVEDRREEIDQDVHGDRRERGDIS